MQVGLYGRRTLRLIAAILEGRDVPVIAGSVDHAGRALSVLLVGRFRQGLPASFESALIGGIAIANVDVKCAQHRVAFPGNALAATANHQHRIVYPDFAVVPSRGPNTAEYLFSAKR